MELSEAQKHLIKGLKLIWKVETDAIIGIVSVLQTREQLYDMMSWLCEHEGASTAEMKSATSIEL